MLDAFAFHDLNVDSTTGGWVFSYLLEYIVHVKTFENLEGE